jgi:PAS domain S-box-containing protein
MQSAIDAKGMYARTTLGVVATGAGLLALGYVTQTRLGGQLLPHSFCISASAPLLYLHLVSDALIALGYLLIPLAMLAFVRRRRDLPFGWVAWVFGTFIMACGATHALEIWTLYQPVYWYSGVMKAFTAVVSLATAWLIFRLTPLALAIPSAAQLRTANEALEAEIRAREQAQSQLNAAKAEVDKLLAQERLRATNMAAVLDGFFEAAPIGLAMLDAQRELVRVNPALSVATGSTQQLPPEIRSVVEQVAAGGRERTNMEIEGRGGPAPRIWRSNVFPVALGEGGRMYGVTVQDITGQVTAQHDREAALASLEEERGRFQSLADNIAQLAWMADKDGSIFWYNRRWFDYTGTTLEQMQGWGWRSVHHADHLERVEEKFRLHLLSGEPWEDTFPLRGSDGAYRWFLSRAVPLRDGAGGIVRWFGSNTDVTEQLQAQEALREADRRKDRFMATLAHELRNPLGPIRNSAEIITRLKDLDPRLLRPVTIIRRQVAHMARLLDDLLDSARIARGTLELQLQDCDLAEVAVQTAEDYRTQLADAGISLHVERRVAHLPVRGDPARLAQAIGNYLQNVLRFARGASVTLRTSLDADRNEAVVELIDTGVGIAPELLPRLFQSFEQASQGVARSQGGLGLGLALTAALARLHGGRVQAFSEGEGRGATFELRLPLAGGAMHDAPIADVAARAPAPARILVIEDNRDAAESLAVLLRGEGHEVRLAWDGTAGVKQANEWLPDLVICDIGLPGDLDGFGVARALKASQRTSAIRLVALSGYVDAASRQTGREAGFEVHLAKPVDLAHLLAVAAQMLAGGRRAEAGPEGAAG